ncbi:hypothetical protein ACVW0X_003973 [Bacillus subtilis]
MTQKAGWVFSAIAHDIQTGGKRPLSYSQYAFTTSYFSQGIFLKSQPTDSGVDGQSGIILKNADNEMAVSQSMQNLTKQLLHVRE